MVPMALTVRHMVLAGSVAASAGSASHALAYTNREYGFSLRKPPGLTVCGEQPPAPNDGVSILLHGHDCDKQDTVTRVSIWAEYNVAHEANTTADVLEALCPSTERISLTIAGKTFMGCPTKAGTHSSQLFAFLRLLPDRPVFDSVIYGVQLTAAGDADAADAATFSDIIRGFRFEKLSD